MRFFRKAGLLLLAAMLGDEFMSCHRATGNFDINPLTCLVDLHLHLDGAISTESAKQLASLQGIEIPSSDEEIEKIMRVSDDCSDLNEFLEKFDFPCSLLMTEIGVKTAVENLLSELEEEGVMYAEIRFAPQLSVGKGISQEQAIRAAIEGTKRAHIPSNIILCCMRGTDNHEANVETVRLAKKYYGKGVCALDIAGAEGLFPTKDFRDIFDLAKSEGVRFTIHAGEAAGPESVWDAIDFGASRIGHGIRSLEDEKLVAYLSEHKIPLEMCPTSNVCTAVFGDISAYPLRAMLKKGLYVTINTDDPAIENTSIKKEFEKLIDNFGLSKDEVKLLLTNSVNASFAEESVKQELLKKIESQLTSTEIKGNAMQNAVISEESQTLGMETLGNARELGGYRTADGHTVKRGVLLRSAKPCGASAADLGKLRSVYHLAVITDFRMSFEREAEPNPALNGVTDLWCPIIDEDLIRANVSGKDAADKMRAASIVDRLRIAVQSGVVGEDMYINFLSGAQGKKGYTEFFRQLLALPEGKSLLFHCTQGKDRTGLGAMLMLSALGVDEDTIMQDYLLTNTFNAPLIEKERAMLSSYNLSDEETSLYLSVMDYVNPIFMQNALDWLKEKYGSPLGYIKTELGVNDADIATLKDKFLE